MDRAGDAHPQSPLNPPITVPSSKPTTWVREIVKAVGLGSVKDPVLAGTRISSGGRGRTPPCFTCRTICQPLLAARCVLRFLFDPSKLENSSRINKMCVISKCTEVCEESRTSVKQSSGGSKISETGGNPMGARGPTNLLFDQNFQETCMKMKKVGHKVCAPPWIRQCKDSQWQSNSIPCHRSELHGIY